MDLNLIPKKLVKLLMEITPGPLGSGLTIEEAGKKLKISKMTIHRWIKEFEEQYPEEYENWMGIVRSYHRQTQSMSTTDSIEVYEERGNIKEVF